MAKFRQLKNSLIGGQISRDAVGRTDLPQYAHSCEVLQNMIPLLSGGAYRRPGTMFQDFIPGALATKNPAGSINTTQSSPPRLIPFIISNQQAYALLLGVNRYGYNPASDPGGGYMQYYRATGNTNEDVTSGAAALPYRGKSLTSATTGTDQCAYTRQGGPGAVANSGTSSTGSQTIIDIADSLQTFDDDVWAVQYCSANDVMFLTHPDYQPQTVFINNSGNPQGNPYDYNLTGLQLAQSRPYLNQNTTAVTLIAAWSGSPTVGTLTASVSFFNKLHGPRNSMCSPGTPSPITDGAIFAIAQGEGSAMTGNNTDNGILFCQVLSVTSDTVCDVAFINGVPSNYSSGVGNGAGNTQWWESAWSNYRGWPRACAIYEQRLALAGTSHQPNAIWFTATTAYGAPISAFQTSCKFSALGDGPDQNIVAGATGVLANGQNYTTPQNWIYSPVDDSQGDGQSTGPLGTQPFRISLATTTLDAIQYLSPDQQLFLGTATQEWIVAPANGAFDVANSTCTIQSHYGSDYIQAIRIGYELMFVLQNRQEVRAYQYNYFDQSFFGEPIQLFFDEYPLAETDPSAASSPNYGRRKYRSIDWDPSRSTLWCVGTDGGFFGVTRDRKLQITTWHAHQIGGFNAAHGGGQELTTGLTAGNNYTDSAYFLCDGSVVSACSVPNPLSGIRDIWVVVKRSYGTGNANIWSVERIVGANTVRQSAYSIVAPGNAQEPLYVDCAYFLTDNGDPTNLDYTLGAQLDGQTVVGTYYSEAWGLFAIGCQGAVDSSGDIVLQASLPPDYGTSANHTMVMGFSYTSIVQPVRPDPPSQVGTSQGALKRISKIYVRVFKTLFFKAGPPPVNGTQVIPLELAQFQPSSEMAQSPEIYTGDKEVFLNNTYDRAAYIYIIQDQPLPFTLVSVSMEGGEYEQ